MILKPARSRGARGSLLKLLGVTTALSALGATLTVAADAPYVGVWVIELRNCGAPPADPNSPLEISMDGYDHYQTHCKFKSVEPREGDFKVAAECTIAGNAKDAEFTLTVSGNTLTFTDETGAQDFLRCK